MTRDGQERIALSYDNATGECNGVILTPIDPAVCEARRQAVHDALVARYGAFLGVMLYAALRARDARLEREEHDR